MQELELKMEGGLCARGGVIAGFYGNNILCETRCDDTMGELSAIFMISWLQSYTLYYNNSSKLIIIYGSIHVAMYCLVMLGSEI